MKQEIVQSLAHDLVHHHTNVLETTIQILGKCVFIIIDELQICACHGKVVSIPFLYSSDFVFKLWS
jgi:hypothetical protein